LRYCQPAPDENDNYRRFISYNIEIVSWESYETPNALKFNLFSTGKPISTKEALLIFEDGYKIPEDNSKGGTGHGLHFIKNIVQLHGGHAGCNPRENGNDFYVILPRKK
jgi:signal transduction histidine kinase